MRPEGESAPRAEPGGEAPAGRGCRPELGGSGKLLATELCITEVFTSARKEASGPVTSLPSLLPQLLDAFLF